MTGAEKADEPKRISPRQQQILELVAAGLSDKQIASKLSVSPRTVQTHLDRFYLQHAIIHKRAAAVAYLLAQKDSRA